MLGDDFNAFWHVSVLPNSKAKVTIPQHVVASLTNASLHFENENISSGRVVLYAQTNSGPEIALVPFTIGKYESTSLDLQLTEGDILNLRVEGDVRVDLCGCITGGFSVQVEQ